MKILRLDLIAFGHFTGVPLDFSGGAEVVHVIYGANEAGKSTALRALRALFYGIEARSPDGFLHDYEKLRIGALVQHSDGTQIDFIRRKGAKNTFLARDGKPADEAPLRSCLSAVDEDLFTSLFGIDHERLVAGGQSILRGGGDVGQSLFAAGLGGASLRTVLEKLDGEAAELFKAQGQNQAINRACREHAEAKKQIAELSLASREYEEHAAALAAAKAERERALAELKSLRSETNRLERIARALPHLPARRRLREELEQLGEVPFLPESFSGQRLSAFAALANSHAQAKANEEKIADLDARIAALPIPETLLSRAEVVTELHQRLGSHRKAARDLPALHAELRTLEKDAARLLADLKLDQPESSRLSRASQRKTQTLANQHQALVGKRDAATRAAQNLARELELRQEERRTLPDVTALRDAVSEAQRHGDLEEDLARQRDALRSAETSAADALKRLGLWSGTLDQLAAFAAPAVETIDRFEKEWLAAENASSQAAAHIREAKTKAAQCEREIEELLLTGSVPSEADLTAARTRREQNWQLIRGAWLHKTAGANDPGSLAESYEADVQTADDLADRLRREATRVAQHAHLAAERDHFTRETNELQAESAQQEAAFTQLREEWRALWLPLDPRPPREMRAWLQKQARLLDQAADLHARREAVAAAEKLIARHRAALTAHLLSAGEQPLRALVSQSQRLVEKADLLTRDIEKLTADSNIAAADKSEAEAAFKKWQAEWRDAMREIGRTETASPDEANEFIADCADLQKKSSEADRLRARIKAIQSDAEGFEKEAAATFAQLTPDRPAPKTEEAIADLHDRLNQANKDAATLAALRKQRGEAAAALEEAKRIVTTEELRLAEMCRQAGCTDPAQLEPIERKSRESQARRAKLEQLDERLLAESAGVELEVFIAGIEAMDTDALTAQIAENLRQISEREEQRSKIDERVGREETLLKAMDGNARAAEAAQKSQAVLGQIEEHAEHFIRLRLASAILRREIERYRAENQDPLLRRAGEFFRELTLGSFTAVTTDFDAGDNPILKGVRASGHPVSVEGMSDGTRDQLFLALQLASVEKFIASCEPMPFIVDDVLIAFDHEREAAVLKVLAELAKKTQVIVFTHHQHLVDLARRTLDGAVQVHDLAVPPRDKGEAGVSLRVSL